MGKFKTKIGRNLLSDSDDQSPDCEASLVVISGSNLGEVFLLSKSPFIIGRNENCDIIATDPLTSRLHAQFILSSQTNDWKVIDTDSTNGTYVNFKKINGNTELKTGDKISIGKTILKFLGSDTIEKKFHDELYNISVLDGLTQICSRSRFDEYLEKSILGARDGDKQLVLCMMDIDFFKKINDEHGHQAGDYILRSMTVLIKKVIRRQDIFARYGGEEFCLLLLNTTPKMGLFVAEKIRKAVESYLFQYEGHILKITLSIGISIFQDGFDSKKFIADADKYLYVSKNNGRNQVSF